MATQEEKWLSMCYTGQKAAAVKLMRKKGAVSLVSAVKDLMQLVYCGPVVACVTCRADVMTVGACAHKIRAGEDIELKLGQVLRALISAKGDVTVAGNNIFDAAPVQSVVPEPPPPPAPTPPPPAPTPTPVPTQASLSTLPTITSGSYDDDDYDDDMSDGYDEDLDGDYGSMGLAASYLGYAGAPVQSRNKYVVVAESARVRSKAALTSALVGTLHRGAVCKVLQKQSTRYLITSPMHGWVSCKAVDGSTLLRNLKKCTAVSPSGCRTDSVVRNDAGTCGTVLGMITPTEAVVHFADKITEAIHLAATLEVVPPIKVGECFKVVKNFTANGVTFIAGQHGVLTSTTSLPGLHGLGCIPDGKTIRGRDSIQVLPTFVEPAPGDVFRRLKMKPAAKIKGIPGAPCNYEAVQLEKEPEVFLLSTNHNFDAVILAKMWGTYNTHTYPLTIFESVPRDLMLEAASAQPEFKDGEVPWVSHAPVHPRGYPTTVKGVRKDPPRADFPKLLCRIQNSSLHIAFDDKRRPPSLSGIQLLKWGLDKHPSTFRRFTPLAGLISLDMITFNFNSTTKHREMLTTPYDALEGYTFDQLISTYGIEQNASGDLKDSHMTNRLLEAGLAERYMSSRYVGKQRLTEEKTRQKYLDAKPDLMRFLLENFPAQAMMPSRPCMPTLEIYALENFFMPSRFYVSGNMGARHLMTMVMGCNFTKIGNSVMCPKMASIGTHEYQPFLTENLPTDVMTLLSRPCLQCALPQVMHPACGQEYYGSFTKPDSTCAVCNLPQSSHGVQGTVTRTTARRNAAGELVTRTYTAKTRTQFTYRHHAMHKFIQRTATSERLGSNNLMECAKCNTQHTRNNQRREQREDLLLWAADRKLNLFNHWGTINAQGVARSIESTLILATADVPFDYEAEYNYRLQVTPRPYQAHAIDWMVQRENGMTPLIKYNAVSYANPEDGQYYYSDVYGEFRDKPFSINGGLLASEMGMGKTVMSLALCMVNGPRAPGDECRVEYNQGSITSLKRKREDVKVKTSSKDNEAQKMGGMPMGGTLIITKATLWGQWSKELRDKVGPNVTVVDYHSGIPAAKRNELPFHEVDFVVTNYDMLGVQRGHEPDCTSPLMNIWWNRVLFDEIHFVSNDGTNQARVTGNLRATNRWLLTGTPVQANHAVVIGLARALYGVRNSDSMADVTQINLCKWFASISLRHTVLQAYTNGTPYLDIPPKTELSVEVKFTKDEMAVYNAAFDALKKEITNLGSGWWPRWNTAATKLRQLSSHFLNVANPFSTGMSLLARGGNGGSWSAHAANVDSGLPVQSKEDVISKVLPLLPKGVADDIRDVLSKPGCEFECPICYEQNDGNLGITVCGHVFCTGCIVPIATSGQACPMCRTRLVNETKLTIVAPSGERVAEVVEEVKKPGGKATPEQLLEYLKTQDGSKIRAMVDKIREVREEDPTAKFVIFAQFERSIHAIEQAIQREGYKSSKIAGAMTQAQRLRATTQFASDEASIAFILTVRSGSCGLNLTSANHVFLMDPCLNPVLELQAIGRCHRISQTKPVVAYRFFAKDTIEEVLSNASGGDGSGKVSIMTPKLLGKYFGLPVPSAS